MNLSQLPLGAPCPPTAVLAQGATSRSVFCMRAHDDELFHRMLSVLTGPSPSSAVARSLVKALQEKVSAGHVLSAQTQRLYELALGLAH